MLLHLGPNVITFRTLEHLGQLLHLGLQQTYRVKVSKVLTFLTPPSFVSGMTPHKKYASQSVMS